ncbi:hypothetical protein [Bacillus cereus group sp. MYBK225-1]|uniref:hypothetical protein n=1 Tax=Bacillus cereus group sp. MYBK225-1 TaxID=3450656 RepID=UPI003F790540
MRKTIRKHNYKVTIYYKDGTKEVTYDSSWLSIEQICNGLRERYEAIDEDEILIDKLTVELIDC